MRFWAPALLLLAAPPGAANVTIGNTHVGASLKIYTVGMGLACAVELGALPAGWSAHDFRAQCALANGLYYWRLRTRGGGVRTGKLLVLN